MTTLDPSAKARLNAAFRALRERGFVARQSFWCCSGCAGNALGGEVLALYRAGKPLPLGAVYYHRQDAESLRATGTTVLRYGQVSGYEGDEAVAVTPLSTVNVGRQLLAVLREYGVPATWDGDPDRCVEVDLRTPEVAP